MKTIKVILLALLLAASATSNAENEITYGKHKLGTNVDFGIIHGKHAAYVTLGAGTSYIFDFHKWAGLEVDMTFTHGFIFSSERTIYADIDYILNVIKFNPLNTNILCISGLVKGNMLNRNGNTLSLGAGMTIRGTFDKINKFEEVFDYDPSSGIMMRGAIAKTRFRSFFGWGLILQASYTRKINDRLDFRYEAGWRGYLGEIGRSNYEDRGSGPSMIFTKFGLVFNFKRK